MSNTYVYDAAGTLTAEYDTVPPSSPCSTCYLTVDALGSTRMMTDGSTGAIKSLHDYLPFGEEIGAGVGGRSSTYYMDSSVTTADGTAQKFTGKERDNESGLDFFEARYYSGAQGRFTSPDEFKGGGLFDPETDKSEETIGPLPYADISDPQTLNKYVYVRNNPLRYVDPDGHFFGIDDAVEAVTAAAVITTGALATYFGIKTVQAINDSMKANAEGQAALASQANKTAASTQASQPSRQAQSTPALPKPPTGPGKTPKDQRDKKRAWSKAENAKKLEQQGGKCAQCGEAKTADEVEGHHIERHADGGQTDDPNHAALCNPCHIDIHKP